MDLPRPRTAHQPDAGLDDLLAGPADFEVVETRRQWFHHGHLAGEIVDAITTGRAIATAAAHEPLNTSALAEVMREVHTLRAESDARAQLVDGLDTVIRPAIAEASVAGVGVLIAYGPDELTARPSVAVKAGQALLLRTDRLSTLLSPSPIAFVGANAEGGHS